MLRQTSKIMTKSTVITNRLSIIDHNGWTDNRLSFQLWLAGRSSNIFGTIKKCSRQEYSSSHRRQETNGDDLGMPFRSSMK